MSIYMYPGFINPSEVVCKSILDALYLSDSMDPTTVSSYASKLDQQSRSGAIWTEFNCGVTGRGCEVIDEYSKNEISQANQVMTELKRIVTI